MYISDTVLFRHLHKSKNRIIPYKSRVLRIVYSLDRRATSSVCLETSILIVKISLLLFYLRGVSRIKWYLRAIKLNFIDIIHLQMQK